MVKRNGRRQPNRRIPTRRTYDPWIDIAVQATNRFVNFGTDYLLDLGQKKLGIKIHSMKTEIEQNRVLCALEKNKAEVALAKQREAEALEKALSTEVTEQFDMSPYTWQKYCEQVMWQLVPLV